jgi:hypothetical protein
MVLSTPPNQASFYIINRIKPRSLSKLPLNHGDIIEINQEIHLFQKTDGKPSLVKAGDRNRIEIQIPFSNPIQFYKPILDNASEWHLALCPSSPLILYLKNDGVPVTPPYTILVYGTKMKLLYGNGKSEGLDQEDLYYM